MLTRAATVRPQTDSKRSRMWLRFGFVLSLTHFLFSFFITSLLKNPLNLRHSWRAEFLHKLLEKYCTENPHLLSNSIAPVLQRDVEKFATFSLWALQGLSCLSVKENHFMLAFLNWWVETRFWVAGLLLMGRDFVSSFPFKKKKSKQNRFWNT